MKFIDDLYAMYKDHLTSDEEDAFIIINGILQEFSIGDIEKLIEELSNEERFEMFGLYVYERFRLKVAQEGIGETNNKDNQSDGYIH